MSERSVRWFGCTALLAAAGLVACGSAGNESDFDMDVVPVTVQELSERT